MQRLLRILCPCALLLFSGCSDMGETTQVATATGGVMGAGLGAIIGSTTGDAGGGAVIGALAGAGAGAAVGGVLESQEESIRTQDEAIERQEQLIRAQRTEIEELKRVSQDSVTFRSKDVYSSPASTPAMDTQNARASFGSKPKKMRRVPVRVLKLPPSLRTDKSVGLTSSTYIPPVPQAAPTIRRAASLPQTQAPRRMAAASQNQKATFSRANSSGLAEKTLVDTGTTASVVEEVQPVVQKPAIVPETKATIEEEPVIVDTPQERALHSKNTPDTTECHKAEEEVNQARGASETADKLFHFRRALRLCPENPSFHLGLGEVYLSLGRTEDAEFEFREALRLDPTYRPAVVQLGALNQPERY